MDSWRNRDDRILRYFASDLVVSNWTTGIVKQTKALRPQADYRMRLMTYPIPHRLAAAFLFPTLLLCARSQATDVGLTINSGSNYAVWDSFPSANFSVDAPDASDGLTSSGLTLASSGIRTGSGDRIYDAGSVATWTATGSTSFDIGYFELQVKNYQFSTSSITTLFTPTLNGLAFDNYTVSYVTEGANTQEIVTWSWAASLAGAAPTSSFTTTFAGGTNNHLSIDGVAVRAANVAPVPEPSTGLLALGATAMAACGRRRRGVAA